MEHVTLTVYGDDDTTPLFEVGTAPGHAAPYLHVMDEMGESDVDLLRGKAQIGQINVRIIDPQTGATQAVRWLTSRLGDAQGFSALNRRRAVLRYASGEVIQDGVIGGSTLNDSFAGFTLPIRDVRERGRKVPAFNRTTSPTVFPRGVKDGYGALPGGGWLLPPTTPVRGTARSLSTGMVFEPTGKGSREEDVVPAVLALSQAQLDAFEFVGATGPLGIPVHTRIRIRWRPQSGGAWNELRGIIPPSSWSLSIGTHVVGPVAQHAPRTVSVQGAKVVVPALQRLSMKGTGTAPTDGQAIEVIVDYVGPPSEQWPFHWEGPWGDAVANLLDGTWSYSDAEDNWLGIDLPTLDPRIRYDAAAVAAIQTPVRIRLTEPREDVRVALEQFCAAVFAAPALNADGEIAPVSSEMPPASASLAQIDDSNCAPVAGWEHPADTAVTSVAVTYRRDYRVPVEADPAGERSSGDGLASREVTVRVEAPQSVLDVMGEQDTLEIDAWMFRALGGIDGQPVTADVTDETGAQQALGHAPKILDRSVYGQQSSFVRLMKSDFPGLAPGDWLIDARSWAPNYATGERGANTLAQVASVRTGQAWLDCRLVSAGPEDALLTAPTFAAPAEAAGVITVSALTAPADVEVQYAIGTAEPTANSGDWTFLGRRTGAGDIESHEFAGGVTVWLRGRSVGLGRRPSAWASAGSAVIAAVPRLHSFTLRLLPDGSVRVEWEASPATEGLRLYHEAHAVGAEPGMASFVDVDATLGSHTFAAALANDARFSVDGEPYPAYPIAGTPGDVVSRVLDTSTEGTGIRWLGEFAVHPANPQVNDAYRNTTDGVAYIWTGSEWDVLARDGLPGTGTGLEVRYSGPAAGQNISGTFNPALHVYMQMRRTDQSWPAEWARIVGEDGDAGADGIYYDYRFRVATTQPATPTGTNPSGWFDSPPAHDPDAGDILWMTRALKNAADGSLLGTWSTPVQLTGPPGPTGPPGTDAPTNAVTGITMTWMPQPAGGAWLMLSADTGSSTGSVRIQYQYSSTPGGALDTNANYYEAVSPGAGLSVLVEGTTGGGPSTGTARTFSPLDPSRTITLTPYTGNDGTGTAGAARTITPEALNETGSVGARIERSGTVYQTDRLRLDPASFAVSMVSGRPQVALAGGAGLPSGTDGSILIRAAGAWTPSLPPDGSVLVGTVSGAAWAAVPMSSVDGLVTALAGKAAASHTHAISQVTGLQAALDGKAASSHTHTIAQVTGLQTALDAKAAIADAWTRGLNGPVLAGSSADLNNASGFHALYASSGATNRPPSGNGNIIGFGLADYTTQLAARNNWIYIRQQEAGVWGPWRQIAEQAWADGRFVALAGSYSNPSWLTALAASKLLPGVLGAGDYSLQATRRLYFDGGGDTYINESAPDRIRIVTGGLERFRVQNADATFYVPVTLTTPLAVTSGGLGMATAPGAAQVPYSNAANDLIYTTGGSNGQVLSRATASTLAWISLPATLSLAQGHFVQRTSAGTGPGQQSSWQLPLVGGAIDKVLMSDGGVNGHAVWGDAILPTGSYANPSWITSLAATKLTGTVASARISGSYTGITAVGTLTTLRTSGKVGIGAAPSTEQLYVSGDIRATGTVYSGSHPSLKRDIVRIDARTAYARLAGLTTYDFRYIDTEVPGTGVLSTEVDARYVARDGRAVSYTSIFATMLPVVQDHEQRIRELERENAMLRAMVRA